MLDSCADEPDASGSGLAEKTTTGKDVDLGILAVLDVMAWNTSVQISSKHMGKVPRVLAHSATQNQLFSMYKLEAPVVMCMLM